MYFLHNMVIFYFLPFNFVLLDLELEPLIVGSFNFVSL